MSLVSVFHAPLERYRIPVEKRCTDTNPGETKNPLGSYNLELDKTYSPVNMYGTLGNILSVPQGIMCWRKIKFSCNLKKILATCHT